LVRGNRPRAMGSQPRDRIVVGKSEDFVDGGGEGGTFILGLKVPGPSPGPGKKCGKKKNRAFEKKNPVHFRAFLAVLKKWLQRSHIFWGTAALFAGGGGRKKRKKGGTLPMLYWIWAVSGGYG